MKTLILLATSVLPSGSGFTVPAPRVSSNNVATPRSPFQPNGVTPMMNIGVGLSWLQMSSDGNDDAATPRTRRKRKDGKQFTPPPAAETESDNDATKNEPQPEEETPVAPETPKENVVVMQVRDIRDVVSGAPEPEPESPKSPTPAAAQVADVNDDDDEELADDEEWEYYDVDKDGNEIIASDEGRVAGRGQDDSIEQLLADARSMRSSATEVVEEETPLKDKIFEVITTIMTIDFFVVLGLLAWFLAGIFCSYVLKDDAVQIAFNMNFERVTQPALGILMVGSVAGAIGNSDDEEEDY